MVGAETGTGGGGGTPSAGRFPGAAALLTPPVRELTAPVPAVHRTRLGVVAGGHPATAEAGATVLRAGGNAADAAVAAVCASMTAEASLTGLGAGGFALVRAPDGGAEVLDFFVSASGQGRSEADRSGRAKLSPYEVPFKATTQVFHVGPASCAIPGMAAGLATLHRRHGRLPLPDVLAPAIRLARGGAVLVPQQDYLHDILEGLLTGTQGMAEIFAPHGALLRAGDRVRVPGLAEALETFGHEGAEPFTHGRYAERVAAFLETEGGLITAEDLRRYEVVVREPVSIPYRGHTILTNPLPSSGGTLIGFTLSLLDAVPLARLDTGALALALVTAFAATEQARGTVFNLRMREPGFAEAFLGREQLDRYRSSAALPFTGAAGGSGSTSTGGFGGAGSTTHVAVIDRDGLAVSLTSSCGSGSGVVVEGTGIIMNNMMGERDLNPGGFFSLPPGARLTSMMAPTVACAGSEGDGDLIALGSAGSERLRSAIAQVVVNMVDRGLSAQEAVVAARAHVPPPAEDPTVVQLEPGLPESVAQTLRAHGHAVNVWPVRDLYFGGVQVAARFSGPTGTRFDGGGDPRRGGVAIFA